MPKIDEIVADYKKHVDNPKSYLTDNNEAEDTIESIKNLTNKIRSTLETESQQLQSLFIAKQGQMCVINGGEPLHPLAKNLKIDIDNFLAEISNFETTFNAEVDNHKEQEAETTKEEVVDVQYTNNIIAFREQINSYNNNRQFTEIKSDGTQVTKSYRRAVLTTAPHRDAPTLTFLRADGVDYGREEWLTNLFNKNIEEFYNTYVVDAYNLYDTYAGIGGNSIPNQTLIIEDNSQESGNSNQMGTESGNNSINNVTEEELNAFHKEGYNIVGRYGPSGILLYENQKNHKIYTFDLNGKQHVVDIVPVDANANYLNPEGTGKSRRNMTKEDLNKLNNNNNIGMLYVESGTNKRTERIGGSKSNVEVITEDDVKKYIQSRANNQTYTPAYKLNDKGGSYMLLASTNKNGETQYDVKGFSGNYNRAYAWGSNKMIPITDQIIKDKNGSISVNLNNDEIKSGHKYSLGSNEVTKIDNPKPSEFKGQNNGYNMYSDAIGNVEIEISPGKVVNPYMYNNNPNASERRLPVSWDNIEKGLDTIYVQVDGGEAKINLGDNFINKGKH